MEIEEQHCTCACACPSAYVYLTRVNVLVLMLRRTCEPAFTDLIWRSAEWPRSWRGRALAGNNVPQAPPRVNMAAFDRAGD